MVKVKKIIWFFSFLLVSIVVVSLFSLPTEAIQPTQQYNKIYLNPFYVNSMSQNVNYTYNVIINPPDGISSVKSAILTFDMWINPTRTFYVVVNKTACNTQYYQVTTTYAGAGRAVATFDCSNAINRTGRYNITYWVVGGNIGSSTAWLDLTYMNNPTGDMKVGGTEYSIGDYATIFLQLTDNENLPVNNGACYLDVYYPSYPNSSHEQFLFNAPMLYKNNSDGLYFYDMYIPNITGVYMLSASCSYTYQSSWFYPPNDIRYSNRTVIRGTYTGDTITLNAYDDGLYTRCISDSPAPQSCIADYSFNLSGVSNLTVAELYYAGESSEKSSLYFYVWNWTSSSWILLPNILVFNGLATASESRGVNDFMTNIMPINNGTIAGNGSVIIKLLGNRSTGFKQWDNWLSIRVLTTTGLPQELKGSGEMHVSNLSIILNASIDDMSNAIISVNDTVKSTTASVNQTIKDVNQTIYGEIISVNNNILSINQTTMAKLENISGDLASLSSQLNNNITSLKNDIYSLNSSIISVNNTVLAVNSSIFGKLYLIQDDLVSINDTVKSSNASLSSQITSVYNHIDDVIVDLISVNNTLLSINQTMNTQYLDIISKILSLNDSIVYMNQNLMAELQGISLNITAISTKLDGIDVNITGLQSDAQTINNNIISVNNTILGVNASIFSKLYLIQDDLVSINDTIKSMNVSVNLTEVMNALAEINASVISVNGTILNVNASIFDQLYILQNDLISINDSINNLNFSVDLTEVLNAIASVNQSVISTNQTVLQVNASIFNKLYLIQDDLVSINDTNKNINQSLSNQITNTYNHIDDVLTAIENLNTTQNNNYQSLYDLILAGNISIQVDIDNLYERIRNTIIAFAPDEEGGFSLTGFLIAEPSNAVCLDNVTLRTYTNKTTTIGTDVLPLVTFNDERCTFGCQNSSCILPPYMIYLIILLIIVAVIVVLYITWGSGA
jgi:predicted  nucleic acid-binding Zn-ribbon protein